MATCVANQLRVQVYERRRANRYTLLLPGTIHTGTQQPVNAESKDVSSRGAYLLVKSDVNLLPGTELDLELKFPEALAAKPHVLFCAHGRAIRVDRSNRLGDGKVGLAVAFETCDFVRSASC